MKLFLTAAAAAATVALSGCATIIDSGTQTIALNTNPEGARVTIVDKAGMEVFSGTTPTTAELANGAGFFQPAEYTVTFEAAGGTKQVPMKGTFNTWTIGNIIFGGIIGLAVDASTGAMWEFSPEVISADMSTAQLQIKTFAELTEAERATLKPLN